MSDDQPQSLAEAIARGLNAHHDHMRENHAEHRKNERLDFLEHLEGEGVEAIQQILSHRLDCSTLPPDVAALVQRICNPTHQAEIGAVAGILISIGYIIAQAIMAGPAATIAQTSMRNAGSLALDPVAMADAAWRDRIADDHARNRAEDSGMSRDKWADTIETVKQTLPAGTWLELWRQGKIGDGDIGRMLRRNGLDDESIDSMMRLRQGPPDVGFAINAITQSQIGWEMFENLLEWNGIEKGWADAIFKTAGASPSVQETLELWNRGLLEEWEVDKIILESPIKNEYVPVLKKMRHRFPALEQTTTLMRRGIFTRAEGIDAIKKLGYEATLAEKMADYAATAQGGAAKNLTVGQMVDLYELGRWDAGKLTTRLTGAGFDPDEAADILDLANERKQHAIVERAATSIGTRYVSWKIDRSTAIQLLDQVNYPGTQRDELLAVWDARREAQTLHLTEAFLHKAFNAGVINADEVRPRLLAMGYDEVDTDIIMRTDFATTAAKKKSKDLSRADEVKRYEKGLITPAQLRERLLALGYDETEAGQIMELSDIKLADAAAKESATNGA